MFQNITIVVKILKDQNVIVFNVLIKQNRVIKQLEKERLKAKKQDKNILATSQPEPTPDVNRNLPVPEQSTVPATFATTSPSPSSTDPATSSAAPAATTAATAAAGKDKFKLPRPADYDDFWYTGDDGVQYNEYDDELEEGYYYDKATETPAGTTEANEPPVAANEPPVAAKEPSAKAKEPVIVSKGLPKPADYEEYWYKGEDGFMYNEYDDELEEGQYYENAIINGSAVVLNGSAAAAAEKVETVNAAEEAAKAAEEAAKAAAEASKNLLKGMSGLGGGLMGSLSSGAKSKPETKQQSGFGFGGLGGLFGSSEPPKKPAPAPVKPAPKPASTPAAKPAPVQVAKPAPTPVVTPAVQPEDKPGATLSVRPTPENRRLTDEDLKNKPFTARMNARQRWKWAYSMARQVNLACRSTLNRTTLLFWSFYASASLVEVPRVSETLL